MITRAPIAKNHLSLLANQMKKTAELVVDNTNGIGRVAVVRSYNPDGTINVDDGQGGCVTLLPNQSAYSGQVVMSGTEIPPVSGIQVATVQANYPALGAAMPIDERLFPPPPPPGADSGVAFSPGCSGSLIAPPADAPTTSPATWYPAAGGGCYSPLSPGGVVWAAPNNFYFFRNSDSLLWRVDTSTLDVDGTWAPVTLSCGALPVKRMVYGAGYIWLLFESSTILAVDPTTQVVTSTDIGETAITSFDDNFMAFSTEGPHAAILLHPNGNGKLICTLGTSVTGPPFSVTDINTVADDGSGGPGAGITSWTRDSICNSYYSSGDAVYVYEYSPGDVYLSLASPDSTISGPVIVAALGAVGGPFIAAGGHSSGPGSGDIWTSDGTNVGRTSSSAPAPPAAGYDVTGPLSDGSLKRLFWTSPGEMIMTDASGCKAFSQTDGSVIGTYPGVWDFVAHANGNFVLMNSR